MPKFVTIGYGGRGGYERTAPEVRNSAHARDEELRKRAPRPSERKNVKKRERSRG
jgi:hypothetical protein